MKKKQKMPVVGAVMTSFPHFVDIDESATQMEAMMDQYAIRHLPVQEKSKIIGIVSERDLHHYVKREAPAAEKDKVRARHIMVPEPYVALFSHAAQRSRLRNGQTAHRLRHRATPGQARRYLIRDRRLPHPRRVPGIYVSQWQARRRLRGVSGGRI